MPAAAPSISSSAIAQVFVDAFFARHPQALQVMRLFDALPGVAFYVKDTESRFVMANRAFLENHAAKDEWDVIGRDDRDLSPPAMAAAYMEEDQRVMRGRQPIPGQVWLVYHAQKMPHWYVSSKTPLFDDQQTVIGLAGAMYPIERPAELASYTRELLPVIQHIEQHYADTVSMARMAKLAGLSSTHFIRRFRQLLRMTPIEYLRNVRVRAARRLLTETDAPLATIAAQTGFTDQSHFTRRFRQTTGLTPAEYRRHYRVAIE
jgi:AraC-like DNA-binding protein